MMMTKLHLSRIFMDLMNVQSSIRLALKIRNRGLFAVRKRTHGAFGHVALSFGQPYF